MTLYFTFLNVFTFLEWLLTIFYVVVLLYMIRGWLKLKSPKYSGAAFTTRVTVLIAARNEGRGIADTIEDLLAQDYPKELTEIIIVDDHSTDNTADIIMGYKDKGVKLLQLTDSVALNSYKKKAISEAIAISTGELMVATDADCSMGPRWLSKIVAYYNTYNPVIISAPVTFFKEKTFFEYLQTLEFNYLIGIGASFIGAGRGTTCNGANFAYRKDVFYEVGGFKGIDDLASGDDELLLQKVAAVYPDRIGFLKDRDAVVYTYAKHSISEFLQQRRRWASKSTKYKDKSFVVFGIGIWAFNLAILLNFAGTFFIDGFTEMLALILFIKFLFEFVFLNLILAFFKRQGLSAYLILLSPLHVIYIVYVGLAGNSRKYIWKGRKVK